MGDMVAFDGKFARRRSFVESAPSQTVGAATKKPPASENQWFAPRVAKAFFCHRQSVEQIAAREKVSRLRVQEVIREVSVPITPDPRRKAA